METILNYSTQTSLLIYMKRIFLVRMRFFLSPPLKQEIRYDFLEKEVLFTDFFFPPSANGVEWTGVASKVPNAGRPVYARPPRNRLG